MPHRQPLFGEAMEGFILEPSFMGLPNDSRIYLSLASLTRLVESRMAETKDSTL
jgi:hypothetical protein